MQEVLKKAADLVELLEQKIASTDTLNRQLSEKKLEQSEIDKKQQAAANQLSARERIVTKFEDMDKAKSDVRESLKRVLAEKTKNNARASELDEKAKSVEKKEKELSELKTIFIKKDEAIDALKIQLENERKLMREKVLEEIKGKL